MCNGKLPPSVEIRIAAASAARGNLARARRLYAWITEGVDVDALNDCQGRGQERTKRAQVLNTPVADLFGHRVETAMDRAGIRYVGQVCSQPEAKIASLPGLGVRLREIVRDKLAEHGLRLGMSTADLSAWVNRT